MRKRRRSMATASETDGQTTASDTAHGERDESENLSGGETSGEHVAEAESVENKDVHAQPLGVFLWVHVGGPLYVCIAKQLHYTCGCVALERSVERRTERFVALRRFVEGVWEKESAMLAVSVLEDFGAYFHQQWTALMDGLCLIARDSMAVSEVCRAFLHTLVEFGFPEEENVEELQLQTNVRKNAELNCYSYQQRTTNQLNTTRRYEGDRRTDEQYLQPRVGRVVRFPFPHPHKEVNTRFQLIEPRRRRPPLEENRIFSHPKRSTSSGMEDFLVEEELQFRALVVLARHLDVFGSVRHLSPFARLTLWNLLDRDEELFDRLCSVPTSPEEADWHDEQLRALRQRVAEKQAALNATRVGAREAAQRLAWYAVSAHWRDQVMRVLEDGEETDWCLLRDTAKMRSRAVFPNYGVSSTVRDIALKALRRVRDGTIDCGPLEDVEECYEVIAKVLVPLLEGSVPFVSPDLLVGGGECVKEERPFERDEREAKQEMQLNEQVESARRYEADQENYESLKRRVESLLAETDDSDPGKVNAAREIRWNLNCEPLLPPDGVVCTFITSIFVWPLQCLAALLELVSVGRHSADGLRKFSALFIPSNWSDELGVLDHLVRREPTNISLASLVGFPRLVRDVYTSAQWLRRDKSFSIVVECRRQASTMPRSRESFHLAQCRALISLLSECGCKSEILALFVRAASPRDADEGKLWTVGELQCIMKTLLEGVSLMMATERSFAAAASSTVSSQVPMKASPASETTEKDKLTDVPVEEYVT